MDPVVFYKCLADKTRLRCILLLLQEGELCVCELIDALQESQPKISRHLAQLKKTGILSSARQGQWVFYRINPSLPTWITDTLTSTYRSNNAFLEQSTNNLFAMRNRPERTNPCC